MSSAVLSAAQASVAREAPRARALPGIGVLPFMARDPLAYMRDIGRLHGDVVELAVPFTRLFLISHPDHVNQVMNRNASRYRRAEITAEIFRHDRSDPPFFVFADDDRWRAMRKAFNPRFSHRNLAALGDRFTSAISDEVDRWERWADTGRRVDLEPELKGLALNVLLSVMFSASLAEGERAAAHRAFDDYVRAGAFRMLLFSAPGIVPRPYRRSGRAASVWIRELIDRLLAERRSHPGGGDGDVLDCLLAHRDEAGRPLSDAEIRVEALGMIIGGHESSAEALAWTFAQLALHPAASARVREEVDALGGRPPQVADMPSLSFVRACFDEAHRLQGGALGLNAQQAIEDDEIGGVTIPAGATVLFSSHALHHDPRFWHAPERFDPERFARDEIDKHAFIPFGLGPRRCLGVQMTYIEAVLTIAAVVQRYELEVPAGWRPAHRLRGSVQIAGGLPVRITRRSRKDG